MPYIGLLFEAALFFFGVYWYLFAIGVIRPKNPDGAKKAEVFVRENGRWIRLAALALMAVMFINLAIGLRDLLR